MIDTGNMVKDRHAFADLGGVDWTQPGWNTELKAVVDGIDCGPLEICAKVGSRVRIYKQILLLL